METKSIFKNPYPKDETEKSTTVNLSQENYMKLKERAEQMHVSINELLNIIIYDFLSNTVQQ